VYKVVSLLRPHSTVYKPIQRHSRESLDKPRTNLRINHVLHLKEQSKVSCTEETRSFAPAMWHHTWGHNPTSWANCCYTLPKQKKCNFEPEKWEDTKSKTKSSVSKLFYSPESCWWLAWGTLPSSAEGREADICGGKRLLIPARPLSCLTATNLQEESYATRTNFHFCYLSSSTHTYNAARFKKQTVWPSSTNVELLFPATDQLSNSHVRQNLHITSLRVPDHPFLSLRLS